MRDILNKINRYDKDRDGDIYRSRNGSYCWYNNIVEVIKNLEDFTEEEYF